MDKKFEYRDYIHIGCGKRNFGNDWIHVDGGNYPHAQNWDIKNLPLPDNRFKLIYSSHLLEYFNREEAREVLREWNRILCPNGVLRLAVPDFAAMAKLYVGGKFPLESFLGPLFGLMQMGNQTIYHKTVYDFESLKILLESCGFTNVRYWDWRTTEHKDHDDCSRAYLPKMNFETGTLISLNVEADKCSQ